MNAYETITERIVEQLEKGIVPWKKEWNGAGGNGLPRNFQTGKPYRGVNILSLLCSEYSSNKWMTYKQAQELGGHVRKGERGTPVVYWNTPKVIDKDSGDEVERGFCKIYFVFNVEQVDGLALTLPFSLLQFNPIEAAETIATRYLTRQGPTLEHGGFQAFYHPSRDHIQMPERGYFKNEHGYYATLFHEMAHSTGHVSRLDRESEQTKPAPFGSPDYSREELIAEFGASFLCGEAGIATDAVIANSAAYIDGWKRRLKADSTLVVMAAQRAQKAADCILGRTFSQEGSV